MAYGKAIKIPRTEVHNCDREDMKGASVYFLFCQEEDGDASVYIGEAENVLERLNQHLRDYQTGKEKILLEYSGDLCRKRFEQSTDPLSGKSPGRNRT